MGGLTLGDLVLDARRAAYVHSLKAVVCSDLHTALKVGIAGGLRGVIERVDKLIADYHPENLVVIGAIAKDAPITGIVRRWGAKCKILFVSNAADADARDLAESLDCEVHNELIWGSYRFVDSLDALEETIELGLFTVAGKPNFSVRVGHQPFGGLKLVVFLRRNGHLILPSMSPDSSAPSVFRKELDRYDVFAAGNQRVLPMGKVCDLKNRRTFAGSLSIGQAAAARHENVTKA